MDPHVKVKVGFDVDESGAEKLRSIPRDAQQSWAALGKAIESLGGPRGALLQQSAEKLRNLGQQGAQQGFFSKDQRKEMERAIRQVRDGVRDFYQAQIEEARKGAEKLANEMRTLQEKLAKETNQGERQRMSREFVAMQGQMDWLRNGGIRANVGGVQAERDRMLNMLKDQSILTQMMPVADDPQQRRSNLMNSFPGQFARGLIGGAVIGGMGYQLAAKVRQEFHEELTRGMAVADLSQRLRPGNMSYEEFRRQAGAIHPSFSPSESTQFLSTYGTLVGGPGVMGLAGQAAGLTRAFGFAPGEGAGIFGQASRLGLDQNKFAESVGQEVIRAQLQGREGEVFHSLLQMSERLIEFLGKSPNMDDMVGLIGRLSMTGLPGLQGQYGTNMAMRFDEGVRGVGLFPLADMRQMALLTTFAQMGVSDPVEMMRLQEQGVLGNPALGRGVLQTIESFGGSRSLLGATAIKQFGLNLSTYDQFREAFSSSSQSGSLSHLRGLVGGEKLGAVPADKLMDVLKLADRAQREKLSAGQAQAELDKIRGEERPEAKVREELANLHQLEAEAVRKMIPAYEKLLSGVTKAADGMLDLNKRVEQLLQDAGVPKETAEGASPFVLGAGAAIGAQAVWKLAKVAGKWMLKRGAAAATGAAAGTVIPGVGTALGAVAGGLALWDFMPSGIQDAVTSAPGKVWDNLKTGGYRGYLRGLITQAAEKEKIPAQVLLALAETESNTMNIYGPKTKYGQAHGVMQILQGEKGPFPYFSREQLMTPEINIPAGAEHFKKLVDKYNGDLIKATAAYNAGAGAVDKYGGVPPYREAQGYVKRFQENLSAEQRLSGHVTVYIRDEKTGELKAEVEAPLASQPTGSPAAATR